MSFLARSFYTTLFVTCILIACLKAVGCESDSDSRSDAVSGDSSAGGGSGSLSQQDADFVAEAAASGIHEVDMGRLGLQRGAHARVREFAQRMVDDHTKANDDLTRTVAGKGVTMPVRAHGGDMTNLMVQSGDAFDREYMRMMVDGHVKAVRLFEEQAANGRDPQIRSFAQRTLPTLRDHLRQAREISSELGANS